MSVPVADQAAALGIHAPKAASETASLISSQKSLFIGDTFPNFTAASQLGEIKFHEWLGDSWGVFFSHPADFTPVCTTELGRVAQLKGEFEKRKTKVIAVSVDSVDKHHQWIKDINEVNKVQVDYPILADTDRKISLALGMLDQSHLNQSGLPLTVRSVFFIAPNKQVKAIITYPASTGRNFDEILRVIDSLQLAAYHLVATPADWVKGKEVVVLPVVSTEDAQKKFPKGINIVRPWLRLTPDPTA
jgi:alkyl hydroperoxide reductase subunit AhpC